MLKKLFLVTLFISHLSPAFAISKEETAVIAEKAYIYAYPLVLMALTKEMMTNTEIVDNKFGRAPINQFSHRRHFLDPSVKESTKLNVDTLVSSAWLDLKSEPLILSLPNSESRYYFMPMLDAWTEVFYSPGKRTTGTKATQLVIVGPDWKGKLPPDIRVIKAPTNMVWIAGRTQTDGKMDYDKVYAFQDGIKLIPLSDWENGKSTPRRGKMSTAVDMRTPPTVQIAKMDGITFFKRFVELLKTTHPHVSDREMLAELKKIGISPGKDFDVNQLSGAQGEVIYNIPKSAIKKINQHFRNHAKIVNGWKLPVMPMGVYGNDYLTRAEVAYLGLGANMMEDAIYPYAILDEKNQPLTGKHRYVIHFAQDKLPPTQAFWSLTMYDAKGYLVSNTLNRYALSDRDKLEYNEDGSLDIYVQKEFPGKGKEANWLPTPDDKFNMALRIYWPEMSAVKGSWTLPLVKRFEEQ